MDSFSLLISIGNWSLTLPIVVHGISISNADLTGPSESMGVRQLSLGKPYESGPDVERLRTALKAKGLPVGVDGVYGPFTDAVVKKLAHKEHK